MNKPVLLHIETSGKICSVCISYGARVVSLQESDEEYNHASVITVLIDEAMKAGGYKREDLSGVVVCDGPGSYTGLRVGLSAAKGISFALDLPLVALNALDTIAFFAQAKFPGSLYFPMIDARRMEVYMSGYDSELEEIMPKQAVLLAPGTFDEFAQAKRLVLAGSGAAKAKTLYTDKRFVFLDERLSAQHLVAPGWEAFRQKRFVNAATHSPFYLKPPNITTPKK